MFQQENSLQRTKSGLEVRMLTDMGDAMFYQNARMRGKESTSLVVRNTTAQVHSVESHC